MLQDEVVREIEQEWESRYSPDTIRIWDCAMFNYMRMQFFHEKLVEARTRLRATTVEPPTQQSS